MSECSQVCRLCKIRERKEKKYVNVRGLVDFFSSYIKETKNQRMCDE